MCICWICISTLYKVILKALYIFARLFFGHTKKSHYRTINNLVLDRNRVINPMALNGLCDTDWCLCVFNVYVRGNLKWDTCSIFKSMIGQIIELMVLTQMTVSCARFSSTYTNECSFREMKWSFIISKFSKNILITVCI